MKLIISILLASLLLNCKRTSELDMTIQFTNLEGDEDQLVFSPAGNQIAFTYSNSGNSDIMIKSIRSDAYETITNSKQAVHSPAWSPDGKKLAYVSGRGSESSIVIHELATGMISQIEGHGSKPLWSPDGRQIVFNSNRGGTVDVYLYDLDSDSTRTVTNQPGIESHFGFSPDGAYIGYNKRRDGKEDLFAISIDGTELINITDHEGHEWYPSWSPAGDGVLFYSTWGDEMTEVWVANFPGTGFRQVSNHIVEDYGPAFSPDGSQVVFISKRDGLNDLYVFHLKTGTVERLNINEKLKEGWPKWSPDGKRLAYSANLEEPYIYELTIATKETRRLTNRIGAEKYPAVDPKGNYVAFSTTGEGSESNILLLDLKSGEMKPFHNTYEGQFRPQFSNRTAQLGVVNSPGGSVRTNNIFTTSLNGEDSAMLTNFGGIRHFVWSFDDREIVYAYDSAANYSFDIWKLSVETGETIPLVQTSGSEIPTTVSKDGSHFLFHSDLSGQNKIYQMPMAGGEAELVEHELQTGWDADYSPNGKQVVFVSNGNAERTTDLYLMNPDGTGLIRLTSDRYVETSPKWSVDGNRILFSVQKGSRDIWLYHFQ